ncbi:MAG: di-heme-cytochrome C peroxidase [Polyangiaceae bacterium]
MKRLHSAYRVRASQVARKVLRPKVLRRIFGGGALALLGFFFLYESVWQFRDSTPSRGAATTRAFEGFGDRSTSSIKYLNQGWTQGQSAWFYTVTQGSDLVPYSFFVSLELAGPHAVPGKATPFASPENYERWRYLEQERSKTNPDGLPVGFTHHDYRRRNEQKSRNYLGLTCAACHTGQVNYKGVAFRIDGGPSMADFETFTADLLASLRGALQLGPDGRCKGDACKRFVAKVLARGDYDDELEVTRDLVAAEQRCAADFWTNRHDYPYGYARLDAFGRIYNRVLGRILRKEDLADILPDAFDASELAAVQQALAPVIGKDAPDNEVIERALPLLNEAQRSKLLKVAFNPSSAPVSYPFLWDIPQHDFVQWNGIVANAALGAVGRNTGEVIGVFGTLDWQVEDGFSLSALFSGQKLWGKHISYRSSVYVHNLRRIERQLGSLMSPEWPPELGALNRDRWLRGKVLFAQHCQSCHARIDRADPDRRVIANMTRLQELGTDPQMAENSVKYSGYSGMLRNQYVDATGIGSLLLDRRAPVAGLLTKSARGVVAWPYPSANVLRRGADWASDLVIAFLSNEIQPSLKNGEYEPDTTAKPFESLLAYKGRSLNGVWATAPFLHNGSVPTLYDLLLPATRQVDDPEGEEYRPNKFLVGSREFDVEKVGFLSQGYDGGFVFDTSLRGNLNAGHEYGTIHDPRVQPKRAKSDVEQLTVKDVQMQPPPVPDGRLKPLTREQRYELVEYLKSL